MKSRTVGLISIMICLAISWLGLRISDPAWAQSCGMDIWNLDSLLSVKEREDLRLMELEQLGERAMPQYHLNQLMIDELLANRRDLMDVADQMYEENKSCPGYAYVIGAYPSDMPRCQQAAEQVLHRARHALYNRADTEEVMNRLKSQYVMKFGTPPLAN